MEKFSQFRDRGSGVSPFIPVHTPTSAPAKLLHAALFAFRLPVFLACATVYFLLLEPLPAFLLPAALRKLLLWGLMGVPGILWVDLQMDGVRRGHLAEQPADRIPHAGAVIAASFTSPIDPLYLAAVFDPVFTVSYPRSRRVRHVSLLGAILHALAPVGLAPPPGRGSLTDIESLVRRYPNRVIAVFPECSTTNGKGVLPPSPSLLAAPAGTHIFPVSIRYSPPDVTTPIPGRWLLFLWALLSQTSICVRVRIAECVTNTTGPSPQGPSGAVSSGVDAGAGRGVPYPEKISAEERGVLDKVAEALARLGRSKRVGLMLEDKVEFVKAWRSKR